MKPRIFHFSFPLVVGEWIPENKDFFLFGIAKIRDGPRAQIDFDTFFKVKKLPKLARRGDGVICTLPKRKRCFFWIPSLEWWKQFGDWESFLISSWHVWSRSHVLPLAQVQLLVVKSEQLSHNKSEDETAFYLVDGKNAKKHC